MYFFLSVYFASCFLSFLDLWCINFHWLWKTCSHYFSNVSSATFFLCSAATSVTCWILCHSSSMVCFPQVLVCIISTDISLRSRHFPPLCHHLMSTSKQFLTSANTLCLVWDLESKVFLSVTEPWHSTLPACWHQRQSLHALVPSPETACHCFMTQGSCWWQRFSQFCPSLSHRQALCTWVSDLCLVMTVGLG